jgi:hypothetical protein
VKRFRNNVILGALAGLGWWILHDNCLCKHGQGTNVKHFICYAIAGSIVTVLIWSPSSFGYGAIYGTLVGTQLIYN